MSRQRNATERAAIQTLAALVARIAIRTWPHLGTDESNDIKDIADRVFKEMLPRLPERAARPDGKE